MIFRQDAGSTLKGGASAQAKQTACRLPAACLKSAHARPHPAQPVRAKPDRRLGEYIVRNFAMSFIFKSPKHFGLAVFCLMCSVIFLGEFAQKRRFLLEAWTHTTAIVTRTEPENHAMAYYSYSVDGKAFSGAGSYAYAKIGLQITVFYLDADPSVSTVFDPRSGFRGILVSAVWGAGFFALYGSLIVYLVQKAKAMEATPPRPEAKVVGRSRLSLCPGLPSVRLQASATFFRLKRRVCAPRQTKDAGRLPAGVCQLPELV
jgi:hypothetical protein